MNDQQQGELIAFVIVILGIIFLSIGLSNLPSRDPDTDVEHYHSTDY